MARSFILYPSKSSTGSESAASRQQVEGEAKKESGVNQGQPTKIVCRPSSPSSRVIDWFWFSQPSRAQDGTPSITIELSPSRFDKLEQCSLIFLSLMARWRTPRGWRRYERERERERERIISSTIGTSLNRSWFRFTTSSWSQPKSTDDFFIAFIGIMIGDSSANNNITR